MKNSKIFIDPHFAVGRVDKRLFGSFVEHLGRCVYGGIYQPGQKTADSDGFRQDVLELTRELNVPVIRYPGGNFVSGYRWEDGVGQKASRPAKAEIAWNVIETNQFGPDEFLAWCAKAGSDAMMAVNLGTRGLADAVNLLEYCNFPKGTYYSDMRIRNGHEQPYGVKLWCLGNEMDGPWQIGHKTAYEYGRIAAEISRAMKLLDPDIETVACGSSSRDLPWFGQWESEVLGQCYDQVDYLSLHHYFGNADNNTPVFLSKSVIVDRFIQEAIALCDAEKAKKKSKKTINLSFDEWNVWYHSHEETSKLEKWQNAPHQLEDVYNLEDALLVGSILITLLRHADRVKIACLAQLVNVIGPIMTSDQAAWKQTIYYPFAYTSRYGRGIVLQTVIESPVYSIGELDEAQILDAVCVMNDDESLTLFAVNKDLNEDLTLTCGLPSENYTVLEHITLNHADLKAANTEADPDALTPWATDSSSVKNGVLTTVLGRHSWNMIRLGKNGSAE